MALSRRDFLCRLGTFGAHVDNAIRQVPGQPAMPARSRRISAAGRMSRPLWRASGPCAPPRIVSGCLRIWREHRRWLIGQALVWGVGVAVLRLVVVPPESCPPVDSAAVRQAISEGAGWLVRG